MTGIHAVHPDDLRQQGARRRTLGRLAAISLVAMLAACGTTPSEPAPEGYYRVERGDTLYSIARRHNRSVSELARWSNISDSSQIEVGQLIRVKPPAGAGISAAKANDKPAPSAGPARSASPETPPSKPPASAIRLQWPADGRVTGSFSPPAEKGLRIEVPAGGKVRAAAAGWAIHVGTLRGYGQLVIIKHNDDWLTVYGNLDRLLVKENDRVSAGQDIGVMSRASELHFEVRGNGKPVNPASYLPSR